MRQQIKDCLMFFITLLFKATHRNCYCKRNCLIVNTCCKGGGKNNVVEMDENVILSGCLFYFRGNGNHVIIHNNVRLKGVTFWMEDNNNVIEIGENTTFEMNVQLAACEGTSIRIGKDCMFSHDIYVRTTDSHSIVNSQGQRINCAKDINIGDHVWIGMQCLILKGANIPDNCIVGARAVVGASKYQSNSLLAGIPAREMKNNIKWLRERI